MSYLEVQHLSYKYPSGPFILKDLNFSLKENNILCILGPTGTGKTSLLRILSGLEKIEQGKIFFKGKKLACCCSHLSPDKRDCSMVFQNFSLFPHMNVKKNILYGVSSNHKKILNEMMDLFELHDLEDKYPSELSGGQQQKVALARSLSTQSSLIFLDEPFSHLDALFKRRLFKRLKEFFNNSSSTIIYTTHNPEDPRCFSDEVAFLKKGKFQFVEQRDQFIQNPYFCS